MNWIVQVERQRDGDRRVTQVTEIAGMEGETQLAPRTNIFKFEVTGETSTGRLTGRYEAGLIRPASFTDRLQYYGLERSWMAALEDVA